MATATTPEPTPHKRTREGVNVNAWVDPEIGRAFRQIVEQFRPKAGIRSHMEEALRDYCRKLGFWPPKEDDKD